MHRGMLLVKAMLRKHRTRVQMGAECFPVFILIEVPVCRNKLVRIKVSHKGTFVLIVGTRKVNCSGTHRWNVGDFKAM